MQRFLQWLVQRGPHVIHQLDGLDVIFLARDRGREYEPFGTAPAEIKAFVAGFVDVNHVGWRPLLPGVRHFWLATDPV
jgi:hypothetical protein